MWVHFSLAILDWKSEQANGIKAFAFACNSSSQVPVNFNRFQNHFNLVVGLNAHVHWIEEDLVYQKYDAVIGQTMPNRYIKQLK